MKTRPDEEALRPITLSLGAQEEGMLRSEAVFQAICEALRTGALRPGVRLREEDVAKQLNVSRTPVREAFGRLLTRRLIKASGGKGMIVRSLDLGEVRELYSMREILEGAAAGMAAQHAATSEIEVLNDLSDQFEGAMTDADQMAKTNRAFHQTIFRAARNRYLDHALQELQDGIALLGPTTFTAKDRPATSAKEHRDIIAAIVARDSEQAERLARAHIRSALRVRLQILHS